MGKQRGYVVTTFADGSYEEYKRKRRVRDEFEVFSPNDERDVAVKRWG